SRRRHTRSKRDWSSDVCSSDLSPEVEVLDVRIQAPSFDNQRFGSSTSGDAVATWDEDSGELTVFVVNRDPATQLALDADLAAFEIGRASCREGGQGAGGRRGGG